MITVDTPTVQTTLFLKCWTLTLPLLTGARHRVLLPLTMALGAVVLIAVDLLCRVLLAPEELPLGVLLALFAAPPFILILRGIRRAA